MKTTQKIAAGALAVSALAAPAFAQNSVTGTGTGNVTIVAPLTVSSTAAMSFGRVVKPASAGTVVLTPANSATYNNLQSVGASTTTVAAFNVIGDGSSTFSIGADTSFSMTGSGGSPIVVNPILSATSGTLVGSAGTTITSSFTVGGTMSLAAAQGAGAYTGTFHVVVAYN